MIADTSPWAAFGILTAAALMFLLALCSKFNLAKHSAAARAEVERRRRG